jgi:FG-GAP-like repeat
MKSTLLLPILVLTAAAADEKPAAALQSTPPPPATGEWNRQQLTEHFWAEGACVADVNKDGKNDVLCGPFWYEGPDFKKTHTIYDMGGKSFARKKDDGSEEKIPGFGGLLSGKNEYANNFISYAHDFDGDGWLDYLVIGFPGAETFWFQNPQGKDELWQRHTAIKVTDNESPMFTDINGDKQPDLLCMSGGTLGYATYNPKNPTAEWKWHNVSGAADKRFQRFTHGIGHGDINSDGHTDIIEGEGWWEQPIKWDGTTPWKKHDVRLGLGAQQLGYDVNGDGKTDIITSLAAHGWGIAWFEQTNDGGAVGWTKHVIVGDKAATGETGVAFSQPHALDFADMNGDGLLDIISGKRFWAHGPGGDAEPNAPAVLWWFELKRESGKAKYIPHFVDGNSGVGTQVMAVDINGDKKLDVVVGNKRGAFVHIRK